MRHRVKLQDTALVLLTVMVAAYVLYYLDIFVGDGGHVPSVEADELPIIGMVLCAGLLIFSWRRAKEHKSEIRRRVAAERHSRELAFRDPLTGLPNRRQLNDQLAVAIHAPPRAGACHALLMLDLNGFKQVNDVHGHGIGDELLIVVAERLLGAMRQGEMVSRLGGDEFAVLAQHLSGAEAASSLAGRMIDAVAAPVIIDGHSHTVGAGVGISLFPFEGCSLCEVMRRADIALYKAKDGKVSAARFYDDEMDRHIKEREKLEADLRDAIQGEEIVPYFQPLVDLQSKQVVGFEVLARWTHSQLGSIAPNRFIPIAEETGLIDQLCDSLLRRACRAARLWPGHVIVAFNISPLQLKDVTLGLRILAILAETGLRPDRLEIEITESAMVRDLDAAKQVLGGLREAGVRVALDDFGTGCSSLYHLTNFKVDKIKIDRGFVQQMLAEPESAAIVNALIGLGRGLGLTVIAEGIECAAADSYLCANGCEQGQGYLFGKAMPASEAAELFQTTLPAASRGAA